MDISDREFVIKGVAWHEYYVMIRNVDWLSSAPRYIEVCLVVLLVWSISSWWLVQRWEMHSVEPSIMEAYKGKPVLADAKELGNVALFGEIVKERVVKKKAYTPVVASALRLKLLATVVAGERSAAVVQLEGSRKQHVFILGATIQAGVTLKEVEKLAIVVRHQGRLERIILQQDKLLASSVSISSDVMPMKHSKSNRKSLSHKYIQKQAKSLSKILQQARALPYMKNGKLEGFVISNIASGSLHQAAGLQNGDIVRKVNGQPVTSTQQAMVMYKSLKNATSIDLELSRNGAIIPIHYKVKR